MTPVFDAVLTVEICEDILVRTLRDLDLPLTQEASGYHSIAQFAVLAWAPPWPSIALALHPYTPTVSR